MWTYSAFALEHFLAPRRYGRLAAPTLSGEYRDDALETAYRVDLSLDERGIIQEAAFEAAGNPVSIASTSFLLELIVNRHIENAATISVDRLERALGGLPETTMRHIPYGLFALRNACERHRRLQGGGAAGRLICSCMTVWENTIREAIRTDALSNVREISESTKAGTGCGSCREDLALILYEEKRARLRRDEAIARRERIAATCTPAERLRLELIEEVLESEIRPGLRLDGGDVELIALRRNRLIVRMRGACTACASAGTTRRFFIQERLRENIDPGIEVVGEDELEESAAVRDTSAKSV